MAARSRAYCFTYNKYDDAGIARLQALACKYLVYGKEVAPTTGTPHLQGMITFKDAKTTSAAIKLLPGCHVEATKDSHASMLYCKKDGDVYEAGVAPKKPSDGGQMEKDRYKRARESAAAGDLEGIDDDLYVRHYSTFKKIKEDHQVKPVSISVIDGFHWYHGPSGSGKSRKAHDENPDAHLKNPNKWWDGYDGIAPVIIDEWDPTHSVLASYLKRWADHHPFSAEIKGGTRILRPRKIIVTSNYTIRECFVEPRDHLPLERRFTEREFSVPHPSSCPQGAMSNMFNARSGSDAF